MALKCVPHEFSKEKQQKWDAHCKLLLSKHFEKPFLQVMKNSVFTIILSTVVLVLLKEDDDSSKTSSKNHDVYDGTLKCKVLNYQTVNAKTIFLEINYYQ